MTGTDAYWLHGRAVNRTGSASQRTSWCPRTWVSALAVVGFLSGWPGLCLANADGNELLRKCVPATWNEFFYCEGYLAGVAETPWPTVPPQRVCSPAGVTLDQITNIVVRYLQAHPETRHGPAPALIIAALAEAFPCRR